MRKRLSLIRGQHGQALIEFALVAPLLLLILFAIFDVASALNDLNDETNLANVAARYASVAPANAPACSCSNTNWCSGGVAVDLYGYVACEAQTDSGSLANGIGVCVSDLGPGTSYAAGDAVKVTVYYPYNFLNFISGVVGKQSITLSSSATMMMESSGSSASWLSGTDTDTNNPDYTKYVSGACT